jgi:hypothetical protein
MIGGNGSDELEGFSAFKGRKVTDNCYFFGLLIERTD